MSIDITGKGFHSGGLLHFSPKETCELCEQGAVLIDIRETYISDFKMFGVARVEYHPFSALHDSYKNLPAGELYIVADSAGLKSKESVLFLHQKGLSEVYNMAGGMIEWERDRLPLRKDTNEQLDGSCMCQLRPRIKNKNKIKKV